MSISRYCSDEPYVIKSGKLEGQSPSMWVFRDRKKLDGMIRSQEKHGVRRGDNILYDAMIWARESSECIVSTRVCPFCGERVIEYISVIITDAGIAVDEAHTSCVECLPQLEASAPFGKVPRIERCRWALLSRYCGTDRKKIQKILDWAFELPRRLTLQEAHKALKRR